MFVLIERETESKSFHSHLLRRKAIRGTTKMKRHSDLLEATSTRAPAPKYVAKGACLAVLPIIWSGDLIGQIRDGR